eukprot:7154264-Prymnesium_polylepis.1
MRHIVRLGGDATAGSLQRVVPQRARKRQSAPDAPANDLPALALHAERLSLVGGEVVDGQPAHAALREQQAARVAHVGHVQLGRRARRAAHAQAHDGGGATVVGAHLLQHAVELVERARERPGHAHRV